MHDVQYIIMQTCF